MGAGVGPGVGFTLPPQNRPTRSPVGKKTKKTEHPEQALRDPSVKWLLSRRARDRLSGRRVQSLEQLLQWASAQVPR